MDKFGFMMELIQEEIFPILQVYHTVEENKQLLQSMSLFKILKKKGLVYAMQSNGPQAKS